MAERVGGAARRALQLIGGLNRGPIRPPSNAMGFTGRRTFRHLAATNSLTLTVNDFIEIMFVATGPTTGVRFFTAIRLKRVSFWCPAETSGSPFPFTFSWYDSSSTPFQGVPYIPVNDVSMDQSRGARHSYVPPPQTQAASWFTSGDISTNAIFNVTFAPAGTIMDIDVEYVIAPNSITGTSSVQRTVAGASAGVVYTSQLPTGTTNWAPYAPTYTT